MVVVVVEGGGGGWCFGSLRGYRQGCCSCGWCMSHADGTCCTCSTGLMRLLTSSAPRWPNGKAFTWRAGGLGSIPAYPVGFFFQSSPTSDFTLNFHTFHFYLGFGHPLQDVALHQCLPLSSLCCFPVSPFT